MFLELAAILCVCWCLDFAVTMAIRNLIHKDMPRLRTFLWVIWWGGLLAMCLTTFFNINVWIRVTLILVLFLIQRIIQELKKKETE